MEPWVSRSSPATADLPSHLKTEYEISKYLADQGQSISIKNHRDSFITDAILDALRERHVNFLRLPLGHWATDTGYEAPYATGALGYVDWLMHAAEQRGMKVLLDMHAAYGSQNGFSHSSPQTPKVAQFCDDEKLQQATVERIKEWAVRYKDHKAFWGIAVLNEPICSLDTLTSYYNQAYAAIRAISPSAFVIISPNVYASDGDVTGSDWKAQELRHWANWGSDKTSVGLDLHLLDTAWALGYETWHLMTVADHVRYINTVVKERVANYVKLGGTPLLIGEWTAAGPKYDWTRDGKASAELQLYRDAQDAVFRGPGVLGDAYWSARVDGEKAWSFLEFDGPRGMSD